jgi:hypothetical protein
LDGNLASFNLNRSTQIESVRRFVRQLKNSAFTLRGDTSMTGTILKFLFEQLGKNAFERTYDEVLTHRKWLLTWLSSEIIARKRRLRVSISEILRLQQGDRYVLIRSIKRPERFGPIGGVIRCFPSGLKILKEELQYEPQKDDTSHPEHFDLRGYILGRRFPRLLTWFYSESGRERNSLIREIVEELEEIGVSIPADIGPHIETDIVRVVHEGPTEAASLKYWQYRLFIVSDLSPEHAASKKMSEAILEALAKHPARLISVTSDEIAKGRSAGGEVIADSSGYLFGNQRLGEEPPLYLS